MRIILIAAVARNGVIGRSDTNGLPWPPYREDMDHFKAVTMGHAVVMGRNTWESIPERFRPLPGRENIIVSTTLDPTAKEYEAVSVYPSLDDALDDAIHFGGYEKLYIIGGARLYAEALPIADELDLTLIDQDYDGDVRFPGWRNFEDTAFLLRDGKLFFDIADVEERGNNVQHVFDIVERRQGTTPELTFTTWRRRA
jgi:dihydrofolate reductase